VNVRLFSSGDGLGFALIRRAFCEKANEGLEKGCGFMEK
jgi:hypothetical protein